MPSMTDRSAMDRPATAMVALLGIVLMAVSLPFLFTLDEGGQAYQVAWREDAAGADDELFAGQGQTQSVTLTVRDALVSNVTVTMPACSDVPGPLAQPAAVAWELFQDNVSIARGQPTCLTDDEVQRVPIGGHPDVGTVTAASRSEAQGGLYERDGFENATHTYRLDFRYTRPTSPAPGLPVGAPTFAGRMGLEVEVWRADVNEPPAEDVR